MTSPPIPAVLSGPRALGPKWSPRRPATPLRGHRDTPGTALTPGVWPRTAGRRPARAPGRLPGTGLPGRGGFRPLGWLLVLAAALFGLRPAGAQHSVPAAPSGAGLASGATALARAQVSAGRDPQSAGAGSGLPEDSGQASSQPPERPSLPKGPGVPLLRLLLESTRWGALGETTLAPGLRRSLGPWAALGEVPAGPAATGGGTTGRIGAGGPHPPAPAGASWERGAAPGSPGPSAPSLRCDDLHWSAPLPPPEPSLPRPLTLEGEPAAAGIDWGVASAARPQGVWPLAKLYRIQLELPCETGTWVGVALVDPAGRAEPSARRWLAQGLLGSMDPGLAFGVPGEVPWGALLDLEVWILPPGADRFQRVRQAVEVLEAWSWDLPEGSPEGTPRLRLSGLAPQARYAARLEQWPLSSTAPEQAPAASPTARRPDSAAVRAPRSAEPDSGAPGRGDPAEGIDRGSLPDATIAPLAAIQHPSSAGQTTLELSTNSAGQAWLPPVLPSGSRALRLVVWLRPSPTGR